MTKDQAEALVENVINAAINVGVHFHKPDGDSEKEHFENLLRYNEKKLYRRIITKE